MVLLENVKWIRTKGHNRALTALRMLFGLKYNLPLTDELAKRIASHMANRPGEQKP